MQNKGFRTLRTPQIKGVWAYRVTSFHADSGKEFPSRALWRGPSWICASLSSVLCPSLHKTDHFSGARWCREKGGKRGGQQRGQKGKQNARKRVRLIRNQFCSAKMNYITGKSIRKQLCNAIHCPQGKLCNNARDYITEEIFETNSVM